MEQNVRSKSSLGKRLISLIKGVGNKPKLITLFALGLALIIFGAVGGLGERDAASDTLYTDEEARLAELCSSVEGVGRCRVMISYEKSGYRTDGAVVSVCIACEGAHSVAVRKRLTELVTALYGIGSNRIYIARLE